MSHGLLSFEIALCDSKIATASGVAGAADKAELEATREAYKFRLDMLEMQIEMGTLAEDEYMQQVQAAVKREEAAAAKLKASGLEEQFQEAMSRIRAMKDELSG